MEIPVRNNPETSYNAGPATGWTCSPLTSLAAADSKLEPFQPYLQERLQAGVWNARVLLRELRAGLRGRIRATHRLAAAAPTNGTGECCLRTPSRS